MSRIGVILKIDGKDATVSTSRRGICDGCSDKSSCSFDNALGKAKPDFITVNNAIGAKLGDHVAFDLTNHTELKMSLLVWGLPLVGLVIGAFIGAGLHGQVSLSQDTLTLFGALIGFFAAFSLVVFADRRLKNNRQLLPSIERVIEPTSCDVTDQPD
jgi:sigma-E factor negative regulatory protein RseC